MSTQSTAEPPRRPSRLRLLLVALGLVVVGAAVWWTWQWYTCPKLEPLQLTGADPDVVAAVRYAEDKVRASPRSAKAWGQLGMVLLANKWEQESVLPFTHAEEFDPTNPSWPYLRGVALVGRNPDEALPCFRRAVACSESQQPPDREANAAASLRLAETLIANGHTQAAEPHFQQALAGPLKPCAEFGLGVVAIVGGDLAGGKQHLLQCADSPLTRQRAAAQLATVSRRLGEDEAAKYSKQAAQLPADPGWPDPLLADCLELVVGKEGQIRLATTLEQQGEVDRALGILRRVASDYPDAQSFLTLGITLGRRGHFQESEFVLRKSLQLEPRLVRAQYYLSLALLAQGEALQQQGKAAEAEAKFAEAAQCAQRATELTPQNGEAHFQHGLALWSLQRRDDAIAAFRQAVATRPELTDAHLWLGRVLAEEGQREEAISHLRDALRFAAPNDPRPQQLLTNLLEAKP